MAELQSASDRPAQRWAVGLLLAVLVAIALLVRLWPLPGWPASDSANYVAVAWSYLQPEFAVPQTYAGPPHDPCLDVGPMAFTVRPGLTWPLAIPIWAFGFRAESFWMFPIAVGLLEVVLAFKIGAAVASRRAGLFAAAIVATLPWCVFESRYAKADQISAVLAYSGGYLAALSPLRRNHAVLCSGAAGALLGWAWLVKESTVLIFMAAGIALLLVGNWRRIDLRSQFVLLTVILAVFVIECLIYYLRTSDPFHRFYAMKVNLAQCKANFFTAESALYGWRDTTYMKALVDRLLISGPRSLLLAPASLGIVLLGTICGAWMIRNRRAPNPSRFVRATSCYLLVLLAIYNFVPTSFSEYRPIPAVYTYFYPLVLPAVTIISVWLAGLSWITSHRPLAICGLIFVCGAAAAISIARNERAEQSGRDLDCLVERLGDRTCLMTDPRTCYELSQRIAKTPLRIPQIVPWDSATNSLSSIDYLLVCPAAIDDLRLRYDFSPPDVTLLTQLADLVAEKPTFSLWKLREFAK